MKYPKISIEEGDEKDSLIICVETDHKSVYISLRDLDAEKGVEK